MAVTSLPRTPFAVQGHHSFYDVPIEVMNDSTEQPFVDSEPRIIAAQIENGPHLQVYSRIQESETLRIVFHGAVRPDVDEYPRFDRVSTMLRTEDSFLSFADPTLTIDNSIRLAWYCGTEKWSPDELIIELIKKAMEKSGAKKLIFIGGSGGGFAAMKYSYQFSDSLCFVFSPQTSAPKYVGGAFPALLEKGYSGINNEEALKKFPRRFENISIYSSGSKNKLYYMQNLTDNLHIINQYIPFAQAVGITEAEGESEDGLIKLKLAVQKRQGHGAPMPDEFNEFFSRAIEFGFKGNNLEEKNERSALILKEVSKLQNQIEDLKLASGRTYRALSRELTLLPWHNEIYHQITKQYLGDSPQVLPPAGSYAIRAEGIAELLKAISVYSPKIIVECGSGSSTAWLGLHLKKNSLNSHIYCLEHNPEYAAKTRLLASDLGVSEYITVIDAPLEEHLLDNNNKVLWYGKNGIDQLPANIDLLFVDGPPANAGRNIRKSAFKLLKNKLSETAMVVVDDASRPSERKMVDEWISQEKMKVQSGFNELVVLEAKKELN